MCTNRLFVHFSAGLCPGLNNVIRDIVNTLSNGYGVHSIYGVKHGYWGFWTPEVVPLDAPNRPPQCPLDAPVLLTPEKVASIHTYGGTMLGVSGAMLVCIIYRPCDPFSLCSRIGEVTIQRLP
jgi:6-phosphofructokinase